jgi:SIR2-like domain
MSPTVSTYFTFETLVLQLLHAISNEENKRFEPHKRVEHAVVDAWLPDGLEDMPGPLAAEIKLGFPRAVPAVRDTIAKLSILVRKLKGQSILLVIGGKVADREREKIVTWTQQFIPELQFRIWDSEALDQRIQRYEDKLRSVLPRLPSIAVENLVTRSVESSPDEWRQDRKQHIESARKAYDRGDLVLVLGAGVSASAGMPDWNTLVSRLLVSMIEANLPTRLQSTEEERVAIARRLREVQDNSPLLEARYIRAGLKESFEAAVSRSLYQEMDKTKAKRSVLLSYLSKLCLPRRSGAGLRSVVTYNFDDLMELHLSERGIPHRPIYRDGEFADRDELAIYHVHGFLPRDLESYDKNGANSLVLSEERYHTLMVDPYSWPNLIQLGVFRENTCLFVGLSLTDPNLRRLLEIASKSNRSSRHFAILKRLKPESLLSRRSVKPNRAQVRVRKELVQAFTYAHHDLQQASLKEFGINIIWVEEYKEVPEIVRALIAEERSEKGSTKKT